MGFRLSFLEELFSGLMMAVREKEPHVTHSVILNNLIVVTLSNLAIVIVIEYYFKK